MKYRISRIASGDIEEICNWIAADNPRAADEFDQRIHETIGLLAQFPGMGHGRPDVSDPRYSFWSVGNYLVCYRVERRTLVVVRVLHGARDFRRIFTRE